jgi:hypothetical protein
MDLLTRGAGFGYIGSTLTSLIYASFTFISYSRSERQALAVDGPYADWSWRGRRGRLV